MEFSSIFYFIDYIFGNLMFKVEIKNVNEGSHPGDIILKLNHGESRCHD